MVIAPQTARTLLLLLKGRHLVLMPDDKKRAFSPFPYDKKFFRRLRPDQVPRFLRCLTDPQKLPQRWFYIDQVSALQNRVDVEKVEAIRGTAGLSAPVVVRIRKDDPWTIADGLHRFSADWLDHKDKVVAYYCDLSEKEETVEPVPGAGKFEHAREDAEMYPLDRSDVR